MSDSTATTISTTGGANDNEWIELLLQYVALPIILGTFFSFTLFYYDRHKDLQQREKDNYQKQLREAQVTYDDVINSMEQLFVYMKYHAWNIAWRKIRPEGTFSEDLIEEDEIKWKEYNKMLIEWRSNKIRYKKRIEIYFGKRDVCSKLYALVEGFFEKLSYELWFMYHENPTNPNIFMQYYLEDINGETTNNDYISIFNAIMTCTDKVLTRAQEEAVHRVTSEAFDELQDKITRLSNEMYESIRRENVGNLRRGGFGSGNGSGIGIGGGRGSSKDRRRGRSQSPRRRGRRR